MSTNTLKRQKDTDVNLNKCSLVHLNELARRQEKILNNKKFINTLPDKGEKIKVFYSKILCEIENKSQIDKTCELMSSMSLQNNPINLEWKEAPRNIPSVVDEIDDEVNPLKIIATHSGTQSSHRIKTEQSAPSLVTSKDIEEARSFSNQSYAQRLCTKFDERSKHERFKPNMPKEKELAKTCYRSSSEKVQKKMGKHWEVTAATPPVPVYDGTGTISLSSSLELQKQQAQKLKEIQLAEATARLRDPSTTNVWHLPSKLMAYRTPTDPTVLFDGTPAKETQDDTCNDDNEGEVGGAVFYNIVDDVPEHS